jgi:hypothetical protein
MSQRLKVIYITSRGHSGSTLLDLLLSSHSRVCSVGEIKCLHSSSDEFCTCGQIRIWECPFWLGVDDELYSRTRLRMSDLDVESDDAAMFADHNRILFEAVSRVTGRSVIVDSSKTVARLRKLIDADIFDITIIHLMRSPFGVVYSNLKRGRDWKYHARNYTHGMMSTRRLLGGRGHMVVRYEDMARRTREVIEPVMRAVDLEFEPQQLQWATSEHHNLGGNHMRFTTDSTIRLDEKWRRNLSRTQKLGVWWLTLPTRFSGTGVYDYLKPLFDGKGVRPAVARRAEKTRKNIRNVRKTFGKGLRSNRKAVTGGIRKLTGAR